MLKTGVLFPNFQSALINVRDINSVFHIIPKDSHRRESKKGFDYTK
jgi:hypothetical protein